MKTIYSSATYSMPYPKDLLPHRDPMLLIDQIDEYTPGVSVKASTFIAPDNRFFEGHFPGEPILPGIILAEMMFQACGIFGRLESIFADKPYDSGAVLPKAKSGRAIKIESLSFSRPVFANDKLLIEVSHKHNLFNFSVFNAKVEIESKGLAAKGVVTVLINK